MTSLPAPAKKLTVSAIIKRFSCKVEDLRHMHVPALAEDADYICSRTHQGQTAPILVHWSVLPTGRAKRRNPGIFEPKQAHPLKKLNIL